MSPTRMLSLAAALVSGLVPPTAAQAAPPPGERPRLAAQLGHADGVTSVAFSPDGRLVLTGSADRTARLWDAASGCEVRCLKGHAGAVTSVCFSPGGKRSATGGGGHDPKTRRSWGEVRLWDTLTGQPIRTLKGHTDTVTSVAFSPDGKRLASAAGSRELGKPGEVKVWDAVKGEEVLTLRGPCSSVFGLAFSPDGKRFAAGGGDINKTADVVRVWDVITGQVILTLKGPNGWVHSVCFSPDGKRLASASDDRTVKVWDAATGQQLLSLNGHTREVNSVCFRPDGKRLASASADGAVKVWDAQTGKGLFTLKGHTGPVTGVCFSSDGKRLASASLDRTVRVWEAATGRAARTLKGRTGDVPSVCISTDGKRIASARADGTVRVWDARSGRQSLSLRGHTGLVASVCFSPDGKTVASAGYDRTVKVWDALTGKELLTLKGHTNAVTSVAFSPDGRRLASAGADRTVKLWDAQTGNEIRTLTGHARWVFCVAFSPDGKRLATASEDRTVKVWDAATGKKTLSLLEEEDLFNDGFNGSVFGVCFSPDGKRLATASRRHDPVTGKTLGEVKVWDAATGQELRTLTGHSDDVYSACFSADGKRITSASKDETVRVWDAQRGKELRRLTGHVAAVTAVAFSRDGKWLLSSGWDGTIRLWDASSYHPLCSLIGFRDGSWAVVDPEGRYDASNGGAIEGLHWVVGNEPIALEQLKERYYDPGLLAKYLGRNKEPLRKVQAFAAPKLFPEVRLAAPGQGKLGITLVNRGGGIGRVVVKINGKELTADARPRGADPDAKKLKLEVDLSGDPRLLPGKKNVIEVQAFNAEGYLRSRGLEFTYDVPAAGKVTPPQLWAVVCGVSAYRGGKIDLHFAAKDAEDFAAALRLAADRLFGPDHVHLTLLTTVQNDAKHRPTRANLLAALEEARKANPGDVLVVYLAGHGVNHGGANGDFYFLSCEAQSGDLTDPEVRRQVAVSSLELTEAIKRVPALKQVLVLDTCASGRLVAKLTEKRNVPSSQVRALERLKDRTGMHVLAGCAADAASYEATRYAQGLLTYSLLLGMRGAALKEGDQVDVLPLFAFACDRVPELARDVGGIQRPLLASPTGGASFPIGRLTSQDRAKVPLQAVRPLVLRCNFQDEDAIRDVLGLSRYVDERLRQASARGRQAPLVFVEARELPGACQVAGRYRIEAGKVTVQVSLFVGMGRKPAARFKVEGEEKKPEELAGRLADEVEKRLTRR